MSTLWPLITSELPLAGGLVRSVKVECEAGPWDSCDWQMVDGNYAGQRFLGFA